jgi:hypothetical protein
MKKFTILAGLMTLALFIGVAGTTFRADRAEARPTDVISFSPDVCAFVIADIDAASSSSCYSLLNPNSLATIADALGGDVDDPDTYADLVDGSAAQVGSESIWSQSSMQSMWVLVFVTNDDPVHLDADEGVWLSSGTSQRDCGAGEQDCNNDGTKGDGVVVDNLAAETAAPLDLGDAVVTATQSGIDVEMDYTVVGPPDDIALTATKDTIQEDSGADCDLGDYDDEIGLPDVTGLLAEVVDEDDTALTGIQVGWDSSDTDAVDLSMDASVSMFSSGQASARNLGCGGDVGEATVTATVLEWVTDDGSALHPTDIDDEIDLTVVGAPASMTLAANPPSITCNGVNNAEVSATLLDSAGKPVVAGNSVRFEVVALGIATPIIAKTDANGVAKSKITPLSGVTAGVTVLVSVVDDDSIEGNVLVACQPAVPIVPPPVTPPVVTPPLTGDAGLLP